MEILREGLAPDGSVKSRAREQCGSTNEFNPTTTTIVL